MGRTAQLLIALLALAVTAPPALAQDDIPDEVGLVTTLSAELADLNERAERNRDAGRARELAAESMALQARAEQCVDSRQQQLERLRDTLGLLSEGSNDGSALDARRQRLERELASCEGIYLQAQDLQDSLEDRARELFTNSLLEQRQEIADDKQIDPSSLRLTPLAIAGGIGLFLGLGVWRWLRRERPALIQHLAPALPAWGACLGLFSYAAFVRGSGSAAMAINLAQAGLLIGLGLGGAAWLHRIQHGEASTMQLPQRGRSLAAVVLLIVTFALSARWILLTPALGDSGRHDLLSTETITAGLAVLGMLVLLGLFARGHRRRLRLFVPFLLTAALAAALVADLSDYRTLGDYLFRAATLSLIATGVWAVAQRLVVVAIAAGGRSNFLVLSLIRLSFIAALLLVIANIWQLPELGLPVDWPSLLSGYRMGEVTLSPLRILIGLLLFAGLVAAVRKLQGSTEKRMLKRTELDAGTRETTITLLGYVGLVLAALMALSAGGFPLTNLVIIASALSVGIGFGLQNIVSNFVSGLILLFERPIRPGDWIRVGTTEGTVRKVRVRSTELRAFDGEDIVIPNADLISNQVVNYTLRNHFGRIVLPIGIAYGSDTQLTRQLLLEIASRHPEVVGDSVGVLDPQALFREFGDNALQFELRCFIRDVAYRLIVRSELCFAIDQAFREAGIEIAFPQRDLHLRSIDDGVAQQLRRQARDIVDRSVGGEGSEQPAPSAPK